MKSPADAEALVAPADGKCSCCLTPYRAGASLHREFGYWVLDVHAPKRTAETGWKAKSR